MARDKISWVEVDDNKNPNTFYPDQVHHLGSSSVTNPWTFTRDASFVQGLNAPAVSIAVGQQTINTSFNDLSCAPLEDGTATCWGLFLVCAIGDTLCEWGETRYEEVNVFD